MAITTQAKWFSAPKQRLLFTQNKTTGVSTNYPVMLSRSFNIAPPNTGISLPLSNVTSGVILTPSNFAGVYRLDPWGSNTGYVANIAVNNDFSYAYGNQPEPSALYDVIYGVGSFPLTSTGTTTLSGQPSFSGRIVGANGYEQLEILCEVCVSNGSNATTVGVTYTNEAGVSGQTSGVMSMGSTGATIGSCQRLNLQAGDKGVQQINSVIIGGTASTAGSVNILVARRLATWARGSNSLPTVCRKKLVMNHEILCMPQIFQNSCLCVSNGAHLASQTSIYSAVVTIVNG